MLSLLGQRAPTGPLAHLALPKPIRTLPTLPGPTSPAGHCPSSLSSRDVTGKGTPTQECPREKPHPERGAVTTAPHAEPCLLWVCSEHWVWVREALQVRGGLFPAA